MAKIDRKAIIHQQAAALFMSKGYTATSMRDLAEAVGIEPSSLYSHIKSKEDLLTKICLDTACRFTDGIESIMTKHTDPLDQVAAVIDLHLEIASDDPSSVTVFSDEWRCLPAVDLQEFEQQRRGYQQQIKQILVAGMEQGVFVDSDAAVLSKTIVTSLRWIHTWHRPDRPIDYLSIGNSIKAFVIRGLTI